jgi:hypothetical protein
MSETIKICRLCMNTNCSLTPIFNEECKIALEVYIITGIKVKKNFCYF